MSEANLFSKDLRNLLSTTANMDIYVATTGDDALGDGSVGAPYATIPRALQDVPKEVRHIVHVHVAAGAYTSFPDVVDYNLVGSGAALSIDASAAMVVVDAGPYTIDVAGAVAKGSTATYDLTVAGGGLTPAAWAGKFLRILTGASAGNVVACADNTATVATVQKGFATLAAGNTFEIVEPGVSISVTHDITMRMRRGSAEPSLLLGVHLTTTGNIAFEAGSWTLAGTVLDYLRGSFSADVSAYGYVFTSLSLAALADDTALVNGYGGTWICNPPAGTETTSVSGTSYVGGGVLMRRSLDFATGSPEAGAVTIHHDKATYGVDAYIKLGSPRLRDVYVRVPNTQDALRIKVTGFCDLDKLFVEQARYALNVGVGASASVADLKGTDATVTNAVYVGQGSRITTKASGCTLVGASGAGNAIKWASGAANSAYPAANNVVTDALGAQVAGY